MSARKKLLKVLDGIAPYSPLRDEKIFSFESVSLDNFDPPAYIVAYLFLTVLGYEDFGGSEKIWWHTFFTYRGHVFLLHDYKFGSWSLAIRKGSKLPDDILRQVIGKIQSASHHADELLSRELKKMIADEKFWLHNGINALKAAFDFYAKELREAISAFDEAVERHARSSATIRNIEKRVDYINERVRLERIISYRAFPLFVSFFSLFEFILDTFYAFIRPDITFLEFRRKVWEERFKALIVIPPGSNVLRMYERLLRIKAQFRNPLTHGLTNETSLLVPVPFGGLTPVTYEHLKSSVHFGINAISRKAAFDALETFEQVLSYFDNEVPYAYYTRYVYYGFSIPIEETHIARIKSKMTSLESFKEYLEDQMQYQEDVTNRDI